LWNKKTQSQEIL